jgi:hypothetical protein
MEAKAGSEFLFIVRLHRKTAAHFSGRTPCPAVAAARAPRHWRFPPHMSRLHKKHYEKQAIVSI